MGSQTARTRPSAAAFIAISGPTPDGSPLVMAIRGLGVGATASAAAASTGAASATPAAASARIVAAVFAAAPAVDDALGVGQLVPQTALQPPAEARQLRRVEAQVLLLRHLDGHRLKRHQEGRTAKRPAA